MEETNISFKHFGSLIVAYLNENLRGLADYVKERIAKHGTKYVVIDFRNVKNPGSVTEIIDVYHALKKTNLYLCSLGDEDKHPYRMLKMMGIIDLPGIEVRKGLEETVVELSQKI